MNTSIEKRTIKKVGLRLIPLMLVCYLVNYLDRINVGFAALHMNEDVGITATVFGWGAGLFFISYFLCEVPSNMALHRVGARRWIARIMITWGIVSTCFAFVQGPVSFMALRFLLGIAEAGFFPGMVLYISYWFPQEYRGRLTALFMTAIPLSALIGAPLSGFLLETASFWSIASWKWMFIIEGVPAIILGVVVLVYLTDRPSEAKWLTPEEKDWLVSKLSVEKTASHLSSFKDAFKSLNVMLMGVIHLGFAVGSYGIAIWLPQILKGHGLSSFHIGLMSMIPYGVAIVGMIAWGALSDKSPNRSLHVAASCMLGAIGLLIAAAVPTLSGAMVGISISTLGVIAARPIFWTLPGSFLTGSAAAAGIAFINAFGNLGGFIGPYVIGLIKDQTGSFTLGIVATSLPLALSVVAALVLAKRLAPLRAVAAANTSESVQEPM
ncbi:MFS transporter [Pseudomonas abietaniphila]|uniref:MFS transporter, ACS family, tartrate transporter n=1 Tax=Pseudomonas abietaniphila TaxID=89065 RepID=A0A1G8JKC1_9PSED|nr:MFS transporter [Pseudomonas abietaniphila]SDI31477.1 MFS transporter, ACS family, tartrate transporter [Pseudomonas abietaniphila]